MCLDKKAICVCVFCPYQFCRCEKDKKIISLNYSEIINVLISLPLYFINCLPPCPISNSFFDMISIYMCKYVYVCVCTLLWQQYFCVLLPNERQVPLFQLSFNFLNERQTQLINSRFFLRLFFERPFLLNKSLHIQLILSYITYVSVYFSPFCHQLICPLINYYFN